jgi:hypothetical protein
VYQSADMLNVKPIREQARSHIGFVRCL